MKSLFLFFFVLTISYSAAGQSPLRITQLTNNFYIYTTYGSFKGAPVPSNAMYVVTDKGIVMIDTPWDTTQCQPLLDSLQARHHKDVVLCISTHYHEDRTGGLDFLKRKGIKTYTSKMTYDLCREKGEKQPEFYFVNDTLFNVGGITFETYYAGEGHTKDNIVIWFPSEKVLYGGCLVKSTEAADLGNMKEVNLDQWPVSIKKVMKKYPERKYVIPGHFSWENSKSLEHTLKLLEDVK